MRILLLVIALLLSFSSHAGYAIVLQDETALRPAPGAAARPNAVLYQGETVEVRGERLDYLRVWDYTRERGGYVRASQVRRLALEPAEAPELLAILRFLRGMSGSEALGIGIAAAYIEAVPPEALEGAEVLDIMGVLAERLARKGSGSHLEVVARYGVRFLTVERYGRMRLCYDGAAYRRLLAMRTTEEQRARAMLALSEPSCLKPEITLAQLLDGTDESALPGYLRNRILMRRASVWASVAYQRARQGEDAASAAQSAAKAFFAINREELAEADQAVYAETQTRVGAVRVALAPPPSTEKPLHIATAPGEPGQTCVMLVDAKKKELARRCTYGHVWPATAVVNGAANALAVAVQPTESWRELWVFRKGKSGWTVRVVPPAASSPGVGYADFAGWTSGGIRVTRQAIVGNRLQITRITYPVRNSAAS